MAAGCHTFVRGNAWSPERFQGESFVIVSVRADALPQERKLMYTAEFGCPTVFLHDALPGQSRRVEIYDPVRGEVPFGGTPLLGLCLQIFNSLERKSSLNGLPPLANTTTVFSSTLGEIVLRYSVPRMIEYIAVPHKAFRVLTSASSAHYEISSNQVLNFQPQLARSKDLFSSILASHPIAALFPGQETPLIDLSSAPELLSLLDLKYIPPSTVPRATTIVFYVLRKQSEPEEAPPKKLEASLDDPGPIFYNVQIRGLRVDRVEEEASSVGACTLAAYLALKLSRDEEGNDLTPTVTRSSAVTGTEARTKKAQPAAAASSPTSSSPSSSEPSKEGGKSRPATASAHSADTTSDESDTSKSQPKGKDLHYVFNFTQSVQVPFTPPNSHRRTSQMCVEVYLSAINRAGGTDRKDAERQNGYEIQEIGLSGRSNIYLRGELLSIY